MSEHTEETGGLHKKDLVEGEALGDDLAPGVQIEPDNKDEELPALDLVPENPDEHVGEEVEGDFDPDEEDDA
jgi:hypothetical protein